MRLLAHVHGYPPSHNAGAEWALHSILADLADRYEWDVTVAVVRAPRGRPRGRVAPSTIDGINVVVERSWRGLSALYAEADVAVTHLDCTGRAVALAARTGTPLAHYVHNDQQLRFHGVTNADLVVWNSAWLADLDWPGPTTIVYPPVWPEWYQPRRGTHDAILFVNPLPAKGASTVWALAERFPDRRFVVVAGGYGAPDTIPRLANVVARPNRPRLAAALAEARIVLMPSHYESWGRVAVEAACAGIPSIAAPTPGLREAGVSFRYIDHRDTDAWADAITALDDPDVYAAAADDAAGRALFLAAAARSQIDALHVALVGLAERERVDA